MKQLPNSKAPGEKGFGTAFFKTIASELIKHLAQNLKHSMEIKLNTTIFSKRNSYNFFKPRKSALEPSSYRPVTY